MHFFPKKSLLTSILSRLMVLGLGVIILTISVARAGWEIWASDDNRDIPANNLIKFTAVFGNGETSPGTYKLPETGILPDNMFYGMKKIRDWMWLSFSQGTSKPRLAIIQADKKIAESVEMKNSGRYGLALEAGNEAVDKLEYADSLINQMKMVDAQTKQLHYQIFWAGYAYKETFTKMKESFELDTDKYSELIKRIDDWNKKQEENRYNWDY